MNNEDLEALYSMAETYLRKFKLFRDKESLDKAINILIKIQDNVK